MKYIRSTYPHHALHMHQHTIYIPALALQALTAACSYLTQWSKKLYIELQDVEDQGEGSSPITCPRIYTVYPRCGQENQMNTL